MKIGQSIQIKDISKFYGNFQALSNVNLKVGAGEFMTILGSSGSGKTTLLKVITGFEKPEQGQVLIGEQDVANLQVYERNIGMLFQNYALFPHMTVEENIAYPLKLRKMKKPEIAQAVGEMISLIKLNGMEKRYPKQLSGGQQQRVALARALVYRPPLLLLDEPLGALDKNLRHEMQFEIKRIQKELGITTISVTHDQEEALTMSDKICIMSHGVVQQCDTPEKIYSEPRNQFVAEFMGSTNLVKGKVVSQCRSGGKLTTYVQTGLCSQAIRIDAGKNASQYDLPDVLVAIRPEVIHLMKDRPEHINSFKAKMVGHVFLGDSVSVKIAIKNGEEMSVKMSNEAFNRYKDHKELEFFFNPDCVTTIYEKEFGQMLTPPQSDLAKAN